MINYKNIASPAFPRIIKNKNMLSISPQNVISCVIVNGSIQGAGDRQLLRARRHAPLRGEVCGGYGCGGGRA